MKFSEDIYKTIFNSATEGLIISNRKGIIQAINPSIENLFGYTEKELIGKTIDILIPKKERDSHQSKRESYYKKPSQRKMGAGRDLYGQTKNGDVIPLEISLNHFKSENEVKVLAMITDITERKKIENEIQSLNQELEERVSERTKALNESQKLYHLIAQNFPKGTINVFDRNLDYVFVEGEELLKMGIDSQRLIGSNYIKRLPKDIRDDVKIKLEDALNGKSISFEIKTTGSYYKINAVPISYEKNKVDQILVVEKNITQEKLAEFNMIEALEREKQLNELKSRFVSMASHEFRTPLSTILSSAGLSEKYLEKKDSDKIQKHLSRIKNSVGLLTSILNDFLSLSKLEENKVEINQSKVNLENLISETIDDIKESSNRNITISFKHSGISDCITDASFMQNICYNLISNAFKYTKSEIHCLSSIDNETITITIGDNGIGIPKEDQENLFGRFFRAKNVTNIQGTGLGLNIVKHYIDLLSGSISFESDEGKTIFKVIIPISKK